MITIRRAEYEDIPGIMQFIDEHWKKGHILARDREFFEWQFVDDGKVNFIIAEDDMTRILYGIDGYIAYNHDEMQDITGCMWKAIRSFVPMLGIEIGRKFGELVNPRYVIGMGLNEKSEKIAKLTGGFVTKLNHYYRLADLSEYKVSSICDKNIKQYKKNKSYFVEMTDFEEFKQWISDEFLRKYVPYKDYRYIFHRYFEHGIYKYSFYQLCLGNELKKAIFVIREVEFWGRRIAKIVDFYGDECLIADSGMAIDELILERKYEYIDFYNYGIAEFILDDAGFLKCDDDSKNIIPCYFEPYICQNVDILISDVNIPNAKVRVFLGDGDQDRPSEIKEVI